MMDARILFAIYLIAQAVEALGAKLAADRLRSSVDLDDALGRIRETNTAAWSIYELAGRVPALAHLADPAFEVTIACHRAELWTIEALRVQDELGRGSAREGSVTTVGLDARVEALVPSIIGDFA